VFTVSGNPSWSVISPDGDLQKGTLDAFGVGFVGGGIVQVLAISGPNQVLSW
jgi:hypothetical protein